MSPTDAAATLRTLGFHCIADTIVDPCEPFDATLRRLLIADVWTGYGHVGEEHELPLYRLAESFIRSIEAF